VTPDDLDAWRRDVARQRAVELRQAWVRWACTLAGLAVVFGAAWVVTSR
jgi:hypothetical protein